MSSWHALQDRGLVIGWMPNSTIEMEAHSSSVRIQKKKKKKKKKDDYDEEM